MHFLLADASLAERAVVADRHLIIHCSLAHQLKISSLGEVPANQSISGFIGTPLPGAIGISKIGLHPQLFLQPSMQVMFTAIIQGGGFTGQFGPAAEEPELYRTGFFSSDPRHLVGEDQAGYRFYLSVNPSSVPLPNNGVSFPMTTLLAIVNLCGSVPDGNPVRDVD